MNTRLFHKLKLVGQVRARGLASCFNRLCGARIGVTFGTLKGTRCRSDAADLANANEVDNRPMFFPPLQGRRTPALPIRAAAVHTRAEQLEWRGRTRASVSHYSALQRVCEPPSVSQLPNRPPNFFAALTRPIACGDFSAEQAGVCLLISERRTAASPPLIAPGVANSECLWGADLQAASFEADLLASEENLLGLMAVNRESPPPDQELVADELAAAANEDRRPSGQACPLLLAAVGRGVSEL